MKATNFKKILTVDQALIEFNNKLKQLNLEIQEPFSERDAGKLELILELAEFVLQLTVKI